MKLGSAAGMKPLLIGGRFALTGVAAMVRLEAPSRANPDPMNKHTASNPATFAILLVGRMFLSPLFVSQCLDRVNTHRPASWDAARGESDGEHDRYHDCICNRVIRFYLKQHGLQDAGGG